MPESRKRPKERKRTRKIKRDWKFIFNTALAILSLIVGGVALIPLGAKAAVKSETPLDPNDVLTTPFEVENQGEFALHDVHVASLITNITQSGDITIDDFSADWNVLPVSPQINPQERETLRPFARLYGTNIPMISADVAVVVQYRPSFSPFTFRRGFRFTLMKQSDGHDRFVPQPANDVVDQYLRQKHTVTGKAN